MTSNKTDITIPSQKLPIIDHFDVIVCGGGAAGCAAAASASRMGARTLIIERDGYLGGATVSQLVGHILTTNGADCQGIWHEWIHALRKRNGVACKRLFGKLGHFRNGVDPEVVKFAWDDILEQAGVEQMLHAYCSQAILENGRIIGVIVESVAGRCAVMAKRVIDATANAVVSASAGADWDQGNETTVSGQSLTCVFRMGNVKWPEGGYTDEQIEKSRETLAQAVDAGEFDNPVVNNGRVISYAMSNYVHQSVAPYRTEMNIFPSRVLNVNPLDPWSLTRAEREGRNQAWECSQFLKKYIDGYKESYLLDTCAHIGLRDSRRITGMDKASHEDAWELKKYDDEIARCSWQIDIWPSNSYDKPAVPLDDAEYKKRDEKIIAGDYFSIRYGCLLVRGIENLLVAGRCISADQTAQGALRIQQTCQATGEAAGMAAAMSIEKNVSSHELQANELVAKLSIARANVEPAFDNLPIWD